jgi:hypothetical protein
MSVFNEPSGELGLSNSVAIGVTSDKPLFVVTLLSALPAGITPINKSALGIDRLSPLLQAIPSVAVASEVAGTRLMKVVIDGPLARVANGEGFRAFRIEGGKIKEHAKLFKPERLQNLVNSAALFQIASVVVAQKHLADISAKLDDIKAGIDSIQSHLENERKSGVSSSLKYLRDIASALQSGERDEAARGQLETIERKLSGINDHLSLDLNEAQKRVNGFAAPGLFDSSDDLEAKLEKEQEYAERIAEEWKLCMSGRWIACGLLKQMIGQTALVTQRQHNLEMEVEAFLSAKGPVQTFTAAVDKRIDTISSLWEWQSTLQLKRIGLRQWKEDAVPLILSRAQSEIRQAQQLLLEREPKVTLMIEMRDGEVIRAYQH